MTSPNPLIQKFACSGCGSNLEFNPKVGQLKCPYCGREESMPQTQQTIEERSFDQFVNANRTQIEALSSTAVEVECPGCRARIAFQPPDVAGKCPFCATGIVAQPHSASPVITPEAVLPFSVDAKVARHLLQKWLSSRWFAPNGLKKLAQQEGIQGIYLPFWSYDCQTHSDYRGDRGDHYYTTETYTETDSEGNTETKTRSVQHTSWHSVSGQVQRLFDDMLIPAVQSVNVKRLEQLEPWDLSQLVPYNSSYLSGFKAQRYQIDLKHGFEVFKEKAQHQIKSDVRTDIGGDEQRVHSISTSYSAVTFKHLLLPVWISSYRFHNQPYQVMINAQSGEVLGDRPYSIWKITVTALAGIMIVAAGFGIKSYSERRPAYLPRPIPSISVPTTRAPIPTDVAFQQAINRAGNAAKLAQLASDRQSWQQVANQWIQAIELLKTVPTSSPNYSIARQKISEYQRNLNYARQRGIR
jgi:ribosomal protein S27E